MLTITEESKEIEHLETDLRRQTQQDDRQAFGVSMSVLLILCLYAIWGISKVYDQQISFHLVGPMTEICSIS